MLRRRFAESRLGSVDGRPQSINERTGDMRDMI